MMLADVGEQTSEQWQVEANLSVHVNFLYHSTVSESSLIIGGKLRERARHVRAGEAENQHAGGTEATPSTGPQAITTSHHPVNVSVRHLHCQHGDPCTRSRPSRVFTSAGWYLAAGSCSKPRTAAPMSVTTQQHAKIHELEHLVGPRCSIRRPQDGCGRGIQAWHPFSAPTTAAQG